MKKPDRVEFRLPLLDKCPQPPRYWRVKKIFMLRNQLVSNSDIMSRIRPYPSEMVGSLAAIVATGTVATVDFARVTNDAGYHDKLIVQEILPGEITPTGDGTLTVNTYRFDETDMGRGYPINQDVSMIIIHGGTATITHMENQGNVEHHLAKLPERVCRQLRCDICSRYTLMVNGVPVPYCLKPRCKGRLWRVKK